MIPALKISALQSYPRSLSISGATYPGEPHLILSLPSLVEADNPKSTIFKDPIELSLYKLHQRFSYLNSKFSGFKSLWTIFFLCMATNASRMHLIITEASFSLYWPFFFIRSNSSPPLRYSRTK